MRDALEQTCESLHWRFSLFHPIGKDRVPIGGTVIIAKLVVTMVQCCTARSDVATSQVMLPFFVRVLPFGPDRESFSSFVSLPEPIDLHMREVDTVEGSGYG